METIKNTHSDKTGKLAEESHLEKEATKAGMPFLFSLRRRTPIERNEANAQPNRLNRMIFLVALAIILNAFFTPSESHDMLKIGDSMPPFTVKLISGDKIENSYFQNKPAIYYFYASWCPCSHKSIKWLKKALNNNNTVELATLGIGIQDTPKKLEEFANLHQLTFPVSNIGGKSMANAIGVKTTPTTIFADSNGIIRWILVGKIERYSQLEEGLKQILPPVHTATVT